MSEARPADGDSMNWSDIAAVSATLFFVMDPIGNMPAFNALLSRFDVRRRARITARELVIALGILLVFLFAGTVVLNWASPTGRRRR
jgi:multiple antibiotic resistance protein